MPLQIDPNHINTKIIDDPNYVQQVSLLLSRLNIDITANSHSNTDKHDLMTRQRLFLHDLFTILKPYSSNDNASPIEARMIVSYIRMSYDDRGSIFYELITYPIAGSKADLALVQKQLTKFIEPNQIAFRLVPASTAPTCQSINMENFAQDILTELFDIVMKSSQRTVMVYEVLTLNPKKFDGHHSYTSQMPFLSEAAGPTLSNQVGFAYKTACQELQQILRNMFQN